MFKCLINIYSSHNKNCFQLPERKTKNLIFPPQNANPVQQFPTIINCVVFINYDILFNCNSGEGWWS